MIITYNDYLKRAACNLLPWDQLKGCNILITGSTGLIGGCIVEVLLSNAQGQYNIYAAGRNSEKLALRFSSYKVDRRLHFINFDVSVPLVSDIKFEYIIHAASFASPNYFASKPVETMKGNIMGVCNLMEYGIRHGLKRFLFISSGEIYGEGDGRAFTENYCGSINTTSPRSCYPSSKRAAETLCISYSTEYNVECVIARPCHVYGPNFTLYDNRAFAQFFRNVINNENIVLKSSGRQLRSWCFVVDCVTGLLLILLKGKNGEAYNIADDTTILSIRDFAEIIAERGGVQISFEDATNEEKIGYSVIQKSVLSPYRLKQLGWLVEGSVREKVQLTIDYLRNKKQEELP